MTGFWVLARKEVLEQRRTWKFLAMVIVFTLPAVLGPGIFAIVTRVQDEPHGVVQAKEALENIGGGIIPVSGYLPGYYHYHGRPSQRAGQRYRGDDPQ